MRQSRRVLPTGQGLTQLLRVDGREVEIRAYMVSDLDRELLEKLADLNHSCFPPCTREACREDITERSDIVYVATNKENGQMLGLAGERTVTSDDKVQTYLSFSGVAKEARGIGVYQRLVYARIMHGLSQGSTIISVHTQNANIENGIIHTLDRLIEEGHIADYTITRVIDKGRANQWGVGKVAGSASLQSKSENLNKEYSVLDVDNGDSFGLIIRLNKA